MDTTCMWYTYMGKTFTHIKERKKSKKKMKTLLTSIERVPWLEDVCTLPWIYSAGFLWEGVHPTSLACADSQSHQLSGRMHRDIHSRHPLIRMGWLELGKKEVGIVDKRADETSGSRESVC